METILVTDSLFIGTDHERSLRNAGFAVERLDKPRASEEELLQAVPGKAGYILGGIEEVTPAVLRAADQLRAISVTAADWRNFIPAADVATERGIAISSTPGANAESVAEYALTTMLAFTRRIFALGPPGDVQFATTRSLSECSVGLVGMGAIAQRLTVMLRAMGVLEIRYYSRTRKPEVEERLGLSYVDFDTLLAASDILSLHASGEAGAGYFDGEAMSLMKPDALLIDTSFTDAVDRDALLQALNDGRIRAALDHEVDNRFSALPLDRFWHSNSHTGFNTTSALRRMSDMATQSMINLLTTGEDPYRVN